MSRNIHKNEKNKKYFPSSYFNILNISLLTGMEVIKFQMKHTSLLVNKFRAFNRSEIRFNVEKNQIGSVNMKGMFLLSLPTVFS